MENGVVVNLLWCLNCNFSSTSLTGLCAMASEAETIIDEAIDRSLSQLNNFLFQLPQLPVSEREDLNTHIDSPDTISNRLFDACFNLMRDNVRTYYMSSTIGWSTAKKRREMREHPTCTMSITNNACELVGFLNWQPAVEEGRAVIYCYELHIAQKWQMRGLGKWFMRSLEMFTQRFYGLQDVMLTAFTANTEALRFYETLG